MTTKDPPILVRLGSAEQRQLAFWCPACLTLHAVTEGRWQITGTDTAPTFRPSLLVRPAPVATPRGQMFAPAVEGRCHLYVTEGKIEFLADSTHAMAGQTVPMVPLPGWAAEDAR